MKSPLAPLGAALKRRIGPRRRGALTRRRLLAAWGQPRAGDAREMADVRVLTDLEPQASAPDRYRIDERTWNDLDMPLVFGALDRTLSVPGAHRLHQILSSPLLARPELEARERLISLMQRDPRARLAVQMELARLDVGEVWDLPRLLWRDVPESPIPVPVLRALSWALPVAALAGFWLPAMWLVAMALFGINIVCEIRLERHVSVHLSTLGLLHRLLGAAGRIAGLDIAEMKDIRAELAADLEKTPAISRRAFLISINDPFDIAGGIRAALLRNAIAFFELRDLIIRERSSLCRLYRAIGLLDAAQAIASFRTQHADHSVPAFADDSRGLCAANIRHPALDAAIGNDLDLADGRSLLLTGSNMSGKTTFLKTVAVNAILAQTVHTALASRYRAPMLRVMSTVNVRDDLGGGKSYYLDEVESVLRLVRAAGSPASPASPCLFIVDEMFRGTNPVERVAAAAEILAHLARADVVLAATHDLEIGSLVAETFDSGHFEEQITGTGLTFDYRLRPGPCLSRNAIALLRLSGYPAAIVDAAARRALASGDPGQGRPRALPPDRE
jgi:MutS domain V